MKAYCIYCGEELEKINLEAPHCSTCGGLCSTCSRSSTSEKMPIFCHKCGESSYVSEENPLCEECQKS